MTIWFETKLLKRRIEIEISSGNVGIKFYFLWCGSWRRISLNCYFFFNFYYWQTKVKSPDEVCFRNKNNGQLWLSRGLRFNVLIRWWYSSVYDFTTLQAISFITFLRFLTNQVFCFIRDLLNINHFLFYVPKHLFLKLDAFLISFNSRLNSGFSPA